MIGCLPGSWNITTAKTNHVLLSCAADEAISILYADVVQDAENISAVKIRIGFGTSVLPAETEGTLQPGVFLNHPGIPIGGGKVSSFTINAPATGGLGESVLLTGEAPTYAYSVVLIWLTKKY
jgi:hypothetical protein